MGRADFNVHLTADGRGTVHLNGEELPGVTAVRVDGIRDQTPLVTLQVRAAVHVEGVGEIQAGGLDADPLAELDAILADVDPETLDRHVLDNAGLGDVGGGAAEYLEALRRYVHGD